MSFRFVAAGTERSGESAIELSGELGGERCPPVVAVVRDFCGVVGAGMSTLEGVRMRLGGWADEGGEPVFGGMLGAIFGRDLFESGRG